MVSGARRWGVAAVVRNGRVAWVKQTCQPVAQPLLQTPEFTVRAITELVVPVAITVLVVQNGQGVEVLRSAGHRPPVNVSAIVSGEWSGGVAPLGAVCPYLYEQT